MPWQWLQFTYSEEPGAPLVIIGMPLSLVPHRTLPSLHPGAWHTLWYPHILQVILFTSSLPLI